MAKPIDSLDTKLIHAGEPRPRIEGSVAMPVFQSAMYLYAGETSYHDLRYIRLNNTPNHVALHRKLAALENAEAALVTASGMAAISSSLLTVLRAGDHLLAQNCLYGGTQAFVTQDFAKLGLAYDLIDAEQPDSWRALLKPTTRAIYVEALTNPLVQVAELEAVVRFARAHGLTSIIDATFATPVNFRPLDLGFDLVVHSATKYLNGHADIVAGAVLGKTALIEEITRRMNHFGGALDPHAAWLLHRGLKTLALRVRCQNENASKLAHFLLRHPAVARVHYPGLESYPGHARAKRLFSGFGGMLSFEPKGGTIAADSFLSKLTIPLIAPSLGGTETLAIRPAVTSHAGMSREERERAGIVDHLIRISVGIEAIDDLIADFDQALSAS
jgi:cystathionine beta-lyase/cystathionine gamma-synthase